MSKYSIGKVLKMLSMDGRTAYCGCEYVPLRFGENVAMRIRDYAGPKFSGDIMSPSRGFRATFLQTERQQTDCMLQPSLPAK